ncbi:aspartate kinase [Candidatus Vallotiella sp. (ex Adelges kitamiensis)]|uniref:aspartate kinase n=1 Tax=Candidatus Vallotiella sp. (ex Adelges kitamiensis) TaxID=2864217 RepID=UPI001CE2900A|nr:aspartate kinase [Candidatus Vallotia sp. (ex Adelges kitamiensis)]
MALIVHKYGGTSMGSVERIRNVAKRVAKWHKAGHRLVVVLSAMAGETNRLLSLVQKISEQPNPRELDMITSTGEQVSVGLLSIALQEEGIDAASYAGWQVAIKTDSAFTKARINEINDKRVLTDLNAGKVVVIAGFQGVDPDGYITTLGRGGSDTSAVAIAAAMRADECLIYTDVDGVYVTDPRVVEKARRLDQITFEEMLEMASLGSKVLQIRSVECAGKYRVKTRVLSSLIDPMIPLDEEMCSGTLITFEENEKMEQAVISGIAFQRDEARIAVINVPDKIDIAYQILGPIAEANIDVDMINQNSGIEGKTDLAFTVNRGDYKHAMNILSYHSKEYINAQRVLGNPQVSKVSLVGVGMRSHVGVASKMFHTLSEEGINIQMISTSEIKISVLIDERFIECAVRALYKEFDLEKT